MTRFIQHQGNALGRAIDRFNNLAHGTVWWNDYLREFKHRVQVCFMILPGTPMTVTPSGTSFTTTAPAPTMALAPIVMFCLIRAPSPICAPVWTRTVPARHAPLAI